MGLLPPSPSLLLPAPAQPHSHLILSSVAAFTFRSQQQRTPLIFSLSMAEGNGRSGSLFPGVSSSGYREPESLTPGQELWVTQLSPPQPVSVGLQSPIHGAGPADDPELSPPAACDPVVSSEPSLPPSCGQWLPVSTHLVLQSPGWGVQQSQEDLPGIMLWHLGPPPCPVHALVGAGSPSPQESAAITEGGARSMLSCPV